MSVQQVDLSAIDTVTIDGVEVTQLSLDGQSIWQRPVSVSPVDYVYSEQYTGSLLNNPSNVGQSVINGQYETRYGGTGDEGSFTGGTYDRTLIDGQTEAAFAVFNDGSNYQTGEVIQLPYGIQVTVNSTTDVVGGGFQAVYTFTVDSSASTQALTNGQTLSQLSTSGIGTGFSLTVEDDNLNTYKVGQTIFCNDGYNVNVNAIDSVGNVTEFTVVSVPTASVAISLGQTFNATIGTFSVTLGAANIELNVKSSGVYMAANNDLTRVASVYYEANSFSTQRVEVKQRTSATSTDWTHMDDFAVGTGTTYEVYPVAMNHDGEFVYILNVTSAEVEVRRWNGTSYVLSQTISLGTFSGNKDVPFFYDYTKSNYISTGQDENTFAVTLGGTTQVVKAYEEVGGTFYQMGADITSGFDYDIYAVAIADHTRNSPTQNHGSVVAVFGRRSNNQSYVEFYEHQSNQTWTDTTVPELPLGFLTGTYSVSLAVSKDLQYVVASNKARKRVLPANTWEYMPDLDDDLWSDSGTGDIIADLAITKDGDRLAALLVATDNTDNVSEVSQNAKAYAYVTYILRTGNQDSYEREQTSSAYGSSQADVANGLHSGYYLYFGASSAYDKHIGGLAITSDAASSVDHNVLLTHGWLDTPTMEHHKVVELYTLTAPATLYEGGSAIVTLTTSSVDNGAVPYTITGVEAADLVEPLTGSFDLQAGTATVTINAVADLTTEGSQTLTLTLDNGGATTDIVLLDTSTS
ncbi:MAG: hypothetical protein ACPH5P_00350 [Akkermansiaceae bacterium]